MQSYRDGAETPGPGKRSRLPRAAVRADALIALLFTAAGIYHFTQPNRAWRSGAIEVACAAALMIAACLLGRRLAALVHVGVAVGITALGIRHLVMGSGWRSGSMELAMAVVLLGVAVVIIRHQPARS